MASFSHIIGIISGLIAIYSLLIIGFNMPELQPFLREREIPVPKEAEPRESSTAFWLFGSLFLLSLAITFISGWSGSDTSGIMFVLLLLAGISSALSFTALPASIPRVAFSLLNMMGLSSIGLFLGSITRGEEGEGLLMGAIAGCSVALITWLQQYPAFSPTRLWDTINQNKAPSQLSANQQALSTELQLERLILEIGRRYEGDVRVTDIALETRFSLDKARQQLESLSERGFCHKMEQRSGGIIYRFPDLR